MGQTATPAQQKAAQIIADARQNHTTLFGLPEDCAPGGLEDGYAIQRAFTDIWSDDVKGWKAGATSPQSQELFSTDEPFYGPIFGNDLLTGPAKLSSDPFHIYGVEAEVAFVLGRDLPPSTATLSQDEMADAVASAHIAMEFVSPRLDKPGGYGVSQLIADGAGNGAVILGPEIANWRNVDLSKVAARMVINGEEISSGTGAEVLGNPINALIWFVARAGGHGHTLKKGDVVITGTLTGLKMAAPGAEAVADFGDLGEVKLNLS